MTRARTIQPRSGASGSSEADQYSARVDPALYYELTDSRGRPRLYHARKMLLNQENLKSLGFNSFEEVFSFGEELFSYWRDLPEYILLRKEYVGKGEKEDRYFAVKCSKRGNDVYQRRIQTRFRWLNQEIPDKKFFEIGDFNIKKVVKTSLLWVTLTWDPSRGDLISAWENLGIDFNKFKSGLKSRYGKFSCLRVWESYESGYPHVHVVIYFHDKDFKVFPHVGANEGITYRISEVESFRSLWHSFVDVQAISSLRNVFTYIKKHQEKIILGLSGSVQEGEDPKIGFDLENIKGLRTLFLCWLFRKRSFSVSGDFREKLHDLISHLHNSNMERQIDLFGNEVVEWVYHFVGVFSGSELGIPSGIWVKKLSLEEVSVLLDQKGRIP